MSFVRWFASAVATGMIFASVISWVENMEVFDIPPEPSCEAVVCEPIDESKFERHQFPSGLTMWVPIPADRIALPKTEMPCECLIGNGCKCTDCKCQNGESVVQFSEPAEVLPEPKAEPEPVAKPVPQPVAKKPLPVDPITGYQPTKATVVMISRSWCGPCQAFKVGPMPAQLVSQGWDFVVDEKATAQSYPSYRVFDGKRWQWVKGVLTGVRLRMLLDPKYAPPVPMNQRVQASGVQWLMDGQPWTRQALIDHLAEHPSHGHSR